MMEQFLAWLLDLSSGTVYGIIGLCSFIENVFPPTPSDLAVALGGFLSQHGSVSWVGVWLVSWLANLSGSIGVYLLARRYGRQFTASRLGQRLLPAEAIVGLEREYLRFGIAGIFLARFLPGFRSFVAPFVGLVNLPPLTALVPTALASAIWYAVIVWAGARVGEEWEAISHFLGQLNRTLGLLALAAGLVLLIWFLRRRQTRPPRRDRLLRAVHRALGSVTVDMPPGTEGDPAAAGAAALLLELADADRQITPAERGLITDYLRERWGLGAAPASEPDRSGPISGPIDSTTEMATVLMERYDHERRIELMTQLYQIATTDGTLSRHEERLMLRAAALLGLRPDDVALARRRVAPPSA